ncbi:hypothetical protein LLH06_06800 [Mucilaginibacter daejeonensis]|uniref:hypothetical protein n=1 Tax=Mucilaginibacter daejeonensis TaxID=398049 RepID=UPI001D17AF28|nr:hypothetical protein [Mucilaginibacter daejeonensis]UEG54668.1 hypothetical protein LLH06_06800 [Mucilaginibacter daejeonensis]
MSKNRMEVSGGLAGTVVFKPTDVIRIVPQGSFLNITAGTIQIIHNVSHYPKRIYFSYSGSSRELLSRIERTGFLDKDRCERDPEQEETINAIQRSGYFPIKKWPAIFVVGVWNLLILADITGIFGHESGRSGPLSFVDLSFLWTVCLLLLFSQKIRQILMKQEHSFAYIRSSLYFIVFVASMMLILSYGMLLT